MQPLESLEGPFPQRRGPAEGELGEMPSVSTPFPALSLSECSGLLCFSDPTVLPTPCYSSGFLWV